MLNSGVTSQSYRKPTALPWGSARAPLPSQASSESMPQAVQPSPPRAPILMSWAGAAEKWPLVKMGTFTDALFFAKSYLLCFYYVWGSVDFFLKPRQIETTNLDPTQGLLLTPPPPTLASPCLLPGSFKALPKTNIVHEATSTTPFRVLMIAASLFDN